MTITFSKEQSERIKTLQDLCDIYAYCERNLADRHFESQEEMLSALPNYCFYESEQERIDELIKDGYEYAFGEYDDENVKRILGENYVRY